MMRNQISEGTGERGSALLIVFVFAAAVAIMLYMEMPVSVFEAQRNKEQLLIDRGNEYAHAAKLYMRKMKQYPPTVEAMENTNRMRFLRKRFKDPFTGKEDWRFLHATPNGMLTDSKVNPGPLNNGAAAGAGGNNASTANNNNGNSAFGGSNGGFGNSNANAAFGNSSANAGFGNSNANTGFGGFNAGSGFGNSNTGFGNSNTNFGNSASASSNNNTGFGGFNSASSSSASSPSDTTITSPLPQRAPAIAANGALPANADPNNPAGQGTPVAPDGSAMPNRAAPPYPVSGTTNPNAPLSNNLQAANNGMDPNTNPQTGSQVGGIGSAGGRPGVPSSVFNSGSASPSSGLGVMQGGGGVGIAGVASKAVGHSIKVINDQENYSLWEFYYDPSKDAAQQAAGALAQVGSGGVQGQNRPSTNSGFNSQPNSSGSGFGNSFGQQGNGNNGFGNSSFGNNSFGSSGFGNSNQANTPSANSTTTPMNQPLQQ